MVSFRVSSSLYADIESHTLMMRIGGGGGGGGGGHELCYGTPAVARSGIMSHRGIKNKKLPNGHLVWLPWAPCMAALD